MRAQLVFRFAILLLTSCALAQTVAEQNRKSQVVLLGTGTPIADPERSGPALAIVIGDNAYLVDAGAGVVRRAAAAQRNGIDALAPTKLKTVFFTHLHEDHTAGYPDLIFNPWMLGRQEALEAFGPKGLQNMTDHLLAAWKQDIDYFQSWNADGYKVRVHELQPGLVYKDPLVTVKAFPVKHGTWKQAFGFRFETPDRVIVISGDTGPSSSIVEACNGCDVLIHEVYCERGLRSLPANRQEHHRRAHTSSAQLAQIATDAKPKLLVLDHQLFFGCTQAELSGEIQKSYSGKILAGRDLDVL